MYNNLFSSEFFFGNTLKWCLKINIFDFMRQKNTPENYQSTYKRDIRLKEIRIID